MAKCTYCGADTRLYVNGVPVCFDCSQDAEFRPAQAINQPGAHVSDNPPTE